MARYLKKRVKYKNQNISASIDAKDMKIPPFNAHRLGESNELLHIFL